jgi:glycosyltransferase involved in cell wall biosynthesis
MNARRAVVEPSTREGLPTLALESMACSCVVLVTDAGGIPVPMVHEETGFPMGDTGPSTDATSIRKAERHANIPGSITNAQRLIGDRNANEWIVEHYQIINKQ